MDEMSLLRDLGQELTPDETGVPPGVGERSFPVSPPIRRAGPTRRALLLGAAAAITGALVVAPSLITGDARHPGPGSAAAAVLEKAANAAADDPVLTVPSGGFVYVESVTRSEVDTITGSHELRERGPLTERRIWLSVDGHDSNLLQERPHGHGAWNSMSLDPTNTPSAYRSDLPTDTTAMLRWIYDHSQGGNPSDRQAFVTVGDTLVESYVPPRSVAAMFRAAAKIPGTSVVRGERDELGRPAVAVVVTGGNARQELLFAPDTFTYLGNRTVLTQADELGPAGTVVGAFAVVRTAAATRAGKVPE